MKHFWIPHANVLLKGDTKQSKNPDWKAHLIVHVCWYLKKITIDWEHFHFSFFSAVNNEIKLVISRLYQGYFLQLIRCERDWCKFAHIFELLLFPILIFLVLSKRFCKTSSCVSLFFSLSVSVNVICLSFCNESNQMCLPFTKKDPLRDQFQKKDILPRVFLN